MYFFWTRQYITDNWKMEPRGLHSVYKVGSSVPALLWYQWREIEVRAGAWLGWSLARYFPFEKHHWFHNSWRRAKTHKYFSAELGECRESGGDGAGGFCESRGILIQPWGESGLKSNTTDWLATLCLDERWQSSEISGRIGVFIFISEKLSPTVLKGFLSAGVTEEKWW